MGKALRKFQAVNLPQLRFVKGYYDGTGQSIMRRVQPDKGRPNNRIVKNYCATVADNYTGFIAGNPVTYTATDGDMTDVRQVLDSNDVSNEDSELLRDALIYGVGYELVYVNESNDVRFKRLCPETVVPIYADDMDGALLYAITASPMADWQDDSGAPIKWRVCVYSDSDVSTYEASNDFTNMALVDYATHYFGDVPLVVFNLNADNTSIFERIISLQDAYNSLLSDEVNDFQAFVDAYMVLKNVDASEEDLATMKATRSILIDGDSDVSYLTKDISSTQVENMLENLNSSIHTISNSPDFSSQEFQSGVSSGTALQFKLVGFNNVASAIEKQLKKALAHRLQLIGAVLSLMGAEVPEIRVTFTHNLPVNVADTANTLSTLRGLVSDETLLAQVPFVDDVQEELERLRSQNEQYMDTYTSPLDNVA